jgi:hypothetical protein
MAPAGAQTLPCGPPLGPSVERKYDFEQALALFTQGVAARFATDETRRAQLLDARVQNARIGVRRSLQPAEGERFARP